MSIQEQTGPDGTRETRGIKMNISQRNLFSVKAGFSYFLISGIQMIPTLKMPKSSQKQKAALWNKGTPLNQEIT
jgi:hypothetical protein